MTGGVQRPHSSLPKGEPGAGVVDALHLLGLGVTGEQLALAFADQRAQPRPAFAQLGDIAHVVEVVVGEQHVRGSKPEPVGRLDQRLDRAAGVDEERRAPLTVGEQIGIRDELRMAGALEDHSTAECSHESTSRRSSCR